MVPFAGWQMPVRYESIIEEHRAVREKAGLFDISHMGVLEVTGRYATQFLDVVNSNYVPWINAGESQYGYLLDTQGNVIDDIMIYKRSEENYIVVVNAVNNDADVAWLQAVNSGEIVIDQDTPVKEILEGVSIRDLKGGGVPADEALVDVALQGPESLNVLRKLLSSEGERSRLERLEKTKFMESTLDGIDVIVSRTGYTGEETGYELFVSPGKAPRLWNLLIDGGKKFGIKPVGLGARDSLRTEMGLPLHGHELAGRYNISPVEAGFGPYVKFHKAFFIGRDALLKGISKVQMTVARFRMASKGVRIAKPGDIVLSSRTQKVVGNVTSCAVDAEGVQVGMAYVNVQSAREGVRIGIIPAQTREASGTREDLQIGDRFPLPSEAVVLSRFPERE
jgi:glycine hydroxymethyltransferase